MKTIQNQHKVSLARSAMRRWLGIPVVAIALFGMAGCSKDSAPTGPAAHATVLMRNGDRYTGTVVSSSPTQLTFLGDDNARHTIDMKDVKSIDYGDIASTPPATAPPPDTAAPAPAPATASAPPPTAPVPSAPPTAVAPPPAPEIPPESHSHPQEAAIRTRSHELRSGTRISVRTDETIDSGKAVEGQVFAADVTGNVTDRNGDVVIPRGSNAQIIIRSASKGGKFKGASDLILDLLSVSVEGRRYELDTVDLAMKGRDGVGANQRTGVFAGGGAAVGAIIGAIAGGGKGAGIGAGSGAAAGVATQILTKGSAIRIPAETVLTFELDRTARFVASADRDRR